MMVITISEVATVPSKEDLILEGVQYIRGKLDDMERVVASDHTRLDDHLTSHKSSPDRIMAVSSIIGVLISMIMAGFALFASTGCTAVYDKDRPLYQIRNLVPHIVPHPEIPVDPVEDSRAALAADGYAKLSTGIGLLVAAAAASFFSNPVLHWVSQGGLVIGGVLGATGLTKIYVAQYLPVIMWAALILLVMSIVFIVRKKDIRNIGAWLRSRTKLPS